MFSGITPAHVGKRCLCRKHLQQSEDHPRTCGEKLFLIRKILHFQKSPPHMRGKAGMNQALNHEEWITPAHAGKSFISHIFSECRRDHPRTCGEKLKLHNRHHCTTGSPPHMRGKAMSNDKAFSIYGITPTHAGKRSSYVYSL